MEEAWGHLKSTPSSATYLLFLSPVELLYTNRYTDTVSLPPTSSLPPPNTLSHSYAHAHRKELGPYSRHLSDPVSALPPTGHSPHST